MRGRKGRGEGERRGRGGMRGGAGQDITPPV